MIKNKKKPIVYISNINIFDHSSNRINDKETGSTVLIPHVCNNIGVFGGGFAAQVVNKFPIVKENFQLLGNKIPLGKVQYIKIATENLYKHSIIMANMVSQNGLISSNNPRPLNYEYLVKSMCSVREYVRDLDKNSEYKTEIHCPKFGSGLAGGDWNLISSLIEDIWYDIPVFVYILKKYSNANRY
jgi:O-acetyl-ADP-ribose deacetylase (regulator of RNase III)